MREAAEQRVGAGHVPIHGPGLCLGPQQAVLIGTRLPGEAVFPDVLIAFMTFQQDLQESA